MTFPEACEFTSTPLIATKLPTALIVGCQSTAFATAEATETAGG